MTKKCASAARSYLRHLRFNDPQAYDALLEKAQAAKAMKAMIAMKAAQTTKVMKTAQTAKAMKAMKAKKPPQTTNGKKLHQAKLKPKNQKKITSKLTKQKKF